MTKARFSEKQAPVEIRTFGNVNYYKLCLNEEIVTIDDQYGLNSENEDSTIERTEYQYDYNEWHDSVTNPIDVENNPDKYINYQPERIINDSESKQKSELTTNERLKSLEEKQALTEQAVQDLILAQMGE